ncbi:DUF3918 family protein [Halalkalibacterium ligniniphilum]|uniref:DUF3918 family protein n=1 Tax=Halalkalibacterium ligniniphilum TaxID=1134413 RepID=UPI00036D47E4|nr:DUF3918 family protein [Halalkalibacterium ligniniphilum]
MMNWLTSSFLRRNRNLPLMNMLGFRRRSNRNGMMMSVLGLGLGAAAYRMIRGRNMNGATNSIMQPIQKAFNQMRNPVG